jgi:hypothetical protein
VGPGSPGIGIGLGHEGDHEADLLGDLLGHEAEESDAVGGLQGRGVLEVEFHLAVAALMVEAEGTEPTFLHRLDRRIQKIHYVQGRLHVVGGSRAQSP